MCKLTSWAGRALSGLRQTSNRPIGAGRTSVGYACSRTVLPSATLTAQLLYARYGITLNLEVIRKGRFVALQLRGLRFKFLEPTIATIIRIGDHNVAVHIVAGEVSVVGAGHHVATICGEGCANAQ